MSNQGERRTHPRYEATLSIQGSTESGGVAAQMVASNLSLGGLYCTSSLDFPEMTRLAVRLVLPPPTGVPEGGQPVDVEAVVVRRREVGATPGNGSKYELALFFTRVEQPAREEIRRFLSAL